MLTTVQTLTLQQRQAIDLAKEILVTGAESLLEEVEVVKIPKNKLGDAQLKNLLAIASETESPGVVINFIRYQMGRDTHKNSWAKNTVTCQPLGQCFIREIETGTVAKGMARVEKLVRLEEGDRQRVKIQLIRHFLGFASRYLKYLEPQRKEENVDYDNS